MSFRAKNSIISREKNKCWSKTETFTLKSKNLTKYLLKNWLYVILELKTEQFWLGNQNYDKFWSKNQIFTLKC